MNSDILYTLALRSVKNIGPVYINRLIDHFGSAQAVWQATDRQLREVIRIGEKSFNGIGSDKLLQVAQTEMSICESNGIQVSLRTSPDYPQILKQCEDSPPLLFVKGMPALRPLTLSIVGTRGMTRYGQDFLNEVFQYLSGLPVVIISGLATGVDTAAHRLALKHGLPTLGVLAHGYSMMYPAANRTLAEEIIQTPGCGLYTEYSWHQRAERSHFLQRNRIVAGLSVVTLVVETPLGGGSISTVGYANQYSREVYALPGNYGQKNSQGCNQLIAQNKARILSNISDFISELKLEDQLHSQEELFPEIKKNIPEHLRVLYHALQEQGQLDLDELAYRLGVPSYQLLPQLLELELLGAIQSTASRQYRII